ncbi:MAG: hypothetical protein ACI37N_03090, partial [Prevotella sp.]
MLHQGLVGLGAEVHHELLDHRAGVLHVAAGGLVLRAVAVTAVAVVAVGRVAVGHQRGGQGVGVSRGLGDTAFRRSGLSSFRRSVGSLQLFGGQPHLLLPLAGHGVHNDLAFHHSGGGNIVVAIAVLGDDPGLLHQSAQTVVGVDALLSVAVDAPDHLIGLVVGVRAGSGDLAVLDVLLQDQVAPLVVG